MIFGVLSFVVLPVVGGALALFFARRSRLEGESRHGADYTYGRVGQVLGVANLVLTALFIGFFILSGVRA
ncbi:hypothetical protein [Euzebya sp.]|uniref:hypothetical protein n=1 Tax=Euzebya sp. TaxID=1971409 RepID=UPI0035121CD9